MKHRVSELEGAFLDAAVAKAEGFALRRHPGDFDLWCRLDDPHFSEAVEPGYWLGDESFRTIIERERISLRGYGGDAGWDAEVRSTFASGESTGHEAIALGPTPLIAAMRAYIASKFGEEVEL